MNHGSLFSGIGGFDLAAEWMGWNNVFHCEWNPFGQQVLKYHFPKSISYHDITKTDFSIHRGNIDIITGGFPCQPYSTAGARKGKSDERHLFPEMLRAIKEIQPRWIIGENVRGLVSWNGGMVFNEVYDDLEREGYEVQSFLIPAAGVNAPHQRYRIWFVAYSNNKGRCSKPTKISKKNGEISEWNDNAKPCYTNSNITTDTKCPGLEHRNETRNIREKEIETFAKRSESSNEFETNGNGIKDASNSTSNGGRQDNWFRKSRFTNQKSKRDNWQNFPTKSPICGGNDGIPRELDSITFPKWRKESIKASGNAIVPQVAYQIFKAIKEFEELV